MGGRKIIVWFSAKGRMDMIGIVRSVTRKEMARFNIWLVEQTARVIRQDESNHLAQQTFLFDLEGLSFRQIAYKPGIKIDLHSMFWGNILLRNNNFQPWMRPRK